ncbi:MAG TPA: SPFH domain-containing protein [Thermodesulfobacteriota bacterium]|nr:SPFH domain-containing protein [Thermodesulfobacteriota bacterium]HNU71673.1 SPFH domain-containing protein [Thermodesulfobacteriota bacterium]HOC38278.1 SPFH domain-containing protein [Thermodesulfobacteriota bacterium]
MALLDILEWYDESGKEILHRLPEQGSADIAFGSQLIVQENQAAVFFRDGKAYDVLGPGRHTLSSLNIPVLTKALSLPFEYKSPFRVSVYCISTKIFTDLKWGTREPVTFKDSELGMVRLRAFGNYTMRIVQPLLFISTMVGTQGVYTTEAISDYLRDVIVSRLNDLIGERLDTILNLPGYYDELAVMLKGRLHEDFTRYGIELIDIFINSITPPDEVQRMIDERTSMKALGDLDRFVTYKAAKALGDAANAEGEGAAGTAAGTGMGLGMGAGLGMMLPGILQKALRETESHPASAACPACHTSLPSDSRFCPRCGQQLNLGNRCSSCNAYVPAGANFCMACGAKVQKSEKLCSQCGCRNLPTAKFCTECGQKL